MLNFSKSLSKSIVGLTASVILIPVISSSASAASLGSLLSAVNDIVSIADQLSANTGTEVNCSNSTLKNTSTVLTLRTDCTLKFDVSTNFNIASAGSRNWLNIYQSEKFWGDSKRNYRLDLTFSGLTIASVSTLGSGDAYAKSWVSNLYNSSHSTGLNLYRAFVGSASDARWLNSYTFSKNFSGTQKFALGGAYLGFAEVNGLGKLKASSTISFTSIATITDLGKRRSSLASFASAASVSDDDFIPVSDEELASISEDNFSTISDDGFSNVYEDDFSTISDDSISTSVPEPSQIGGLAALLTMLLATKRSRFAKKHTKEAEKLVGKTAVKV
ncbi:PEP-CTERM sorting domain-containing protein [Aerosakkonema sp. BLCC-F183]|uniref:PEP-CTERM sorting domain-containing protein n=1 Tax=Aerosakkonema sp. BLCC-F183 TaxID=3342834 RepID=UPI0035B74C5F